MVSCSMNMGEPRQAPVTDFPAPTRNVDQVPVTSSCITTTVTNTHTNFTCSYHNGNYGVSSLCVKVSVFRHYKDEFVMSLRPFCSGGIGPNDTRTVYFTIRSDENRKLTNGCGRKLETCYMRVDPIRDERILP